MYGAARAIQREQGGDDQPFFLRENPNSELFGEEKPSMEKKKNMSVYICVKKKKNGFPACLVERPPLVPHAAGASTRSSEPRPGSRSLHSSEARPVRPGRSRGRRCTGVNRFTSRGWMASKRKDQVTLPRAPSTFEGAWGRFWGCNSPRMWLEPSGLLLVMRC